jgi:exonuclease III
MKTTSSRLFLLIAFFGVLLASGCGEHKVIGTEPAPPSFVQPQGETETFELATWNIENFPQEGSTVELVSKIITALDIDLYAIQEISDTSAFRDLMDLLPAYDGFFSGDSYSWGYQKTGVIYKRSIVSVIQIEQLFDDDWYAFTRPPLKVHMVAQKDGRSFDFVLIAMHLKAGGNDDDFDRRREAAEKLKAYLDDQLATADEKDYIVAGDWNDEIDDPPADNAFTVFIDDSLNYRFLTASLAGQVSSASYPRYNTLIDHILISHDAFSEYQGGWAKTLRLDEELSNYLDEVSDHRPVMAAFPVFGE